MKNFFSLAFVSLSIFTLGLFFIDNVSVTQAAQFGELINTDDNPTGISTATNAEGSARNMLKTFLNYFLTFLGLIATAMIIFGGFLYITSGGDDQGKEKGKKILMYAGLGILIILISFALVNTLLTAGRQGGGL